MKSALARSGSDPKTNGPLRECADSDTALLERFTRARDEDAFAELVRRHGPMVLGVCRRVLRDREDAQDAFQVTFLVLARKAEAISAPELLASWLYGVAYRTALGVRDRSARRQRSERRGADMCEPTQQPPDDTAEALAILDEELNHLPEMYRTLLVLCYLEGCTHEEAARRLECPIGSVSWRLSQAREQLHRRLAHRGLGLSFGVFGLFLWGQQAGMAGVTSGLAEETARTAIAYADGTTSAVSEDLATLTEEVLRGLRAVPRRSFSWLLALILLLLFGFGAAAADAAWVGFSGHEKNSPGLWGYASAVWKGATKSGGRCRKAKTAAAAK